MDQFNKLFIILAILLIFFLQYSFFSGVDGVLGQVNLLIILLIFYSYQSSAKRFLIAILAGALLDWQFASWGIYLVTFLLISELVVFIKRFIATTGRSGQFLLISLLALLVFNIFPYLLSSSFFHLNISISSLAFSNLGSWFYWQKIIVNLVINLLILWLIYFNTLRKRSYQF